MPLKPFVPIAALAFAAPAFAADAPSPTPYALHCGHLFDANTGKLLGETTVITDGKRIKDVKPGRADAPGARFIELGSATCLLFPPGAVER